MFLINLVLLTISSSAIAIDFNQYLGPFPDHEIEFDDSEIDPKIFFNLKNIDLNKPETYNVFMEPKINFFPEINEKLVENPYLDYFTDKGKYDDEQYLMPSDDVKPVVEKQIERYAEDAPAQAVSYEHRRTSDGVSSLVTHHGNDKKYLAPKVAKSESFSYQGRKFSYKLN